MSGSPNWLRQKPGKRHSRRYGPARPTYFEVRYGISRDAAKLFEWIEGLRDKDYLGNGRRCRGATRKENRNPVSMGRENLRPT